MGWRFWQNSQSQVLSDKIQETLTAQFHLDQQSVYKLRCVQKSGQYSGRPVRYVRILDPEMVSSEVGATISFAQLSSDAERKALRFEGRIEKDGSVHMTDRRTSAVMQNPLAT